MMKEKIRVKIYFSYNGASFYGWQRQKNASPTIQEVLEQKLSQICGERVVCVASGRTDSGVHARVQVAHADIPQKRLGLLEKDRFVLALNSLLPQKIRIYKMEVVSPQFHAGTEVVKKTYLYFINVSPVQGPSLALYSWHLRLPLNWKAIEEATRLLVGTHDFKAFCDADSSVKTTTRTLFEAHWGEMNDSLFGNDQLRVFRVTGSGFLKHMVRSLVGTLVHIGQGRTLVSDMEKALQTGDRKLAGPTAPPQGLWLWDILYKK